MKTALIARLRSDRGSAAVEFALVAPLVLLVALGVLQLTLALHVRSTLTAAAAEGARAGALAYSNPSFAERRTRAILSDALGGGMATSIDADRTLVGGVPVVRVRIIARLPLVGLMGPTAMTVEGHAMVERT